MAPRKPDPDIARIQQIRDEVRRSRREQKLPEQIDDEHAVDEVTAVLLSLEEERRLGIQRRYDD